MRAAERRASNALFLCSVIGGGSVLLTAVGGCIAAGPPTVCHACSFLAGAASVWVPREWRSADMVPAASGSGGHPAVGAGAGCVALELSAAGAASVCAALLACTGLGLCALSRGAQRILCLHRLRLLDGRCGGLGGGSAHHQSLQQSRLPSKQLSLPLLTACNRLHAGQHCAGIVADCPDLDEIVCSGCRGAGAERCLVCLMQPGSQLDLQSVAGCHGKGRLRLVQPADSTVMAQCEVAMKRGCASERDRGN